MDLFEGDQEEPASLHKYVYAQNDPADNLDPTGLTTGTLAEQSTVADIETAAQTLVNRSLNAGRKQIIKKIGCQIGKGIVVEGVYILIIEGLEAGPLYYVGQSADIQRRYAEWVRYYRQAGEKVVVTLGRVLEVVPGVNAPRARKFVREIIENSVKNLLRRMPLLNKNRPIDPEAFAGRLEKWLPDVIKKNFDKAVKVTKFCN
jgi:hypothetical protein